MNKIKVVALILVLTAVVAAGAVFAINTFLVGGQSTAVVSSEPEAVSEPEVVSSEPEVVEESAPIVETPVVSEPEVVEEPVVSEPEESAPVVSSEPEVVEAPAVEEKPEPAPVVPEVPATVVPDKPAMTIPILEIPGVATPAAPQQTQPTEPVIGTEMNDDGVRVGENVVGKYDTSSAFNGSKLGYDGYGFYNGIGSASNIYGDFRGQSEPTFQCEGKAGAARSLYATTWSPYYGGWTATDAMGRTVVIWVSGSGATV